MINTIIFGLLLLPLHWVVTDLREGKIKNYFIFPSLFVLVILAFFIDGFYQNRDNLISLSIIISFAYLFYKNNKWGAWDGKYLILLWLSTTIIGYLKGVPFLILHLFIYTFSIFLIYVIGYLVKNLKEAKKIHLKRYKIDMVDLFFRSVLLFCLSFSIMHFLPEEYSFLVIFIVMMLVLPIMNGYIKNQYLKYLIIVLWLLMVAIKQVYISYAITMVIYVLFGYVQDIFDQIFDIIDTRKIEAIHLRQWNILTRESREKIKSESWIEVGESPLQGLEIFNILNFYKESWKEKDVMIIYKDIKLGIILYISYVLIILKIFK